MSGPVARPVALSTAPRSPRYGAGFDATSAATHAPCSSSFSRISGGRLDQIASQLTPTDLAILELVSRTRICSGHHLERLFFTEGTPPVRARRARRALRRLTDWRILDRLPRQVGGRRAGSQGFLYAAGPAGARLLARRSGVQIKRLVRPAGPFIAHTLAITDIVVGLHLADREAPVDVLEVQTEPTCWRGFLGTMGGRNLLKPDLYIRVGLGVFEHAWFVELDMGTQGRGAIAVKAKRYLRYYRTGIEQAANAVFPRIVWAAPSARRAEQLTAFLEDVGGDGGRLFTVCHHDELLGCLTSETPS